jgi:transposase
MFSLGNSQRYLLYSQACDMRKGFDGLCGLVNNELNRSPTDGAVYIFINRQRNQIKLLCWEPGGFVLYHKRLERGRFSVPDLAHNSGILQWPDLVLIVEGIEISTVRKKSDFIILPESWTRGLVKKSLNLTKRYDQTNPTQIHA